MSSMPKIGDIIQIRNDLEGCIHINPEMKQYQGATAKVMRVFRPQCNHPKTVTFGVHLDIDNTDWYWYEDAMILNPDDRFKC